jgi:hypothetical protein
MVIYRFAGLYFYANPFSECFFWPLVITLMTTNEEISHRGSSRVAGVIFKGLPLIDKMPGSLDAHLAVFLHERFRSSTAQYLTVLNCANALA